MTPTEAQLRILRNCAAGRPFEDGFVHQDNAVKAMWQCLLAGWVSKSQITDEGREVLEAHTPIKGNFEVTVVAVGDKPV